MIHTEEQTRKQLIDQKLHLAGWNVTDPSQVIQELDIDLSAAGHTVAEPTTSYTGHQFVDRFSHQLLHGLRVECLIFQCRRSLDVRFSEERENKKNEDAAGDSRVKRSAKYGFLFSVRPKTEISLESAVPGSRLES